MCIIKNKIIVSLDLGRKIEFILKLLMNGVFVFIKILVKEVKKKIKGRENWVMCVVFIIECINVFKLF